MPKRIFTLLLGLFGFLSVYASFPITDNGNINEISLSVEDPDIGKSERRLWFALGLLLNIYGLVGSMIYQLITQNKGPIKYAFYGFLSFIVLVVIFLLILIADLSDFNLFVFS